MNVHSRDVFAVLVALYYYFLIPESLPEEKRTKVFKLRDASVFGVLKILGERRVFIWMTIVYMLGYSILVAMQFVRFFAFDPVSASMRARVCMCIMVCMFVVPCKRGDIFSSSDASSWNDDRVHAGGTRSLLRCNSRVSLRFCVRVLCVCACVRVYARACVYVHYGVYIRYAL